MITFKHRGNFKNTEKFFKKMQKREYMAIFDKYGNEGVLALSAATPVDSGETAKSWSYKIRQTKSGIKLTWTNSNVVDGIPIAIIIQYGHGTRNGGYVQGLDYINPAMRPIFEKLTNELWKEVAGN